MLIFSAGLSIVDYNISAPHLSYTLRMRRSDDPSTHWYVGEDIWVNGKPYEVLADHTSVTISPNYWSTGFLSLQYAIDSIFIEVQFSFLLFTVHFVRKVFFQ